MKIVQSLEESGLLVKEINETIKNETKKQIVVFFAMLLETSANNILGNPIAGKGVIRASEHFSCRLIL